MVTPRKWRVPKLANSESNAGRYSRKFTVVRSPYIIFPMSSLRYPMHLPVNGVPFLRPWFFLCGIRGFPSIFHWSPSVFSNPHCKCNVEVYFKILLRPSIILKIESELTTDAFFGGGEGLPFPLHSAVLFPWHSRDSACFSRVSFVLFFPACVSTALFRVPCAFRLSTFILNLNLVLTLT